MKKILMIGSLALASTLPAFAAAEQLKTSGAKESGIKTEKTEAAKENPKVAKKAKKHSKKPSEVPKAN
jgi:hypothetical protein